MFQSTAQRPSTFLAVLKPLIACGAQVRNPTSDTEVLRLTLQQLTAQTQEDDRIEEQRVGEAAQARVL